MQSQKIKVGLADDHTILRHGLESIIKQEQDIEVIGEASNGIETLKLVETKRPDILILDIAMPKLNGIEATKHIKRDFPETKIIILSMYDDQEYIYELFSCGISGYLSKESVSQDLITAIRLVFKGDFYLSPSISKKVIDIFVLLKQGKNMEIQSSKGVITKRENEILQYIAEGMSSKEIGELLNISMKTVDTHRNNIMKKLNIHRKTELVKYAIEQGIIKINTNMGIYNK